MRVTKRHEFRYGINDKLVYFSAMTAFTCLLAFDTFQLLDVTGPSAVLGAANDLLGCVAYELRVVSAEGGLVRSNCGVEIQSISISAIPPDQVDAFFVAGGDPPGLSAMFRDAGMRKWAVEATKATRRYGSICSGSAVLASWGMIGARRFATHWAAVPYVRKLWPRLNLDAEAIYVADGPLWTSAGITTGIDMMLAIVEQDHGAEAARAIAQRLVLSTRRPGWQSQFAAFDTHRSQGERYADLISWIALNLHQRLDVETLAAKTGESVRSFHRNFAQTAGKTPAAFVAAQRIERARDLIVGGVPLKQVASRTGFQNVAQLSGAFQRLLGMSATAYRIVHGASDPERQGAPAD